MFTQSKGILRWNKLKKIKKQNALAARRREQIEF